MTYAELYDETLEEVFGAQIEKIPFLRGCSVGKLMRENDSIFYNCGFSDWFDDISKSPRDGPNCCECDERKAEFSDDVGQDDEVLCSVCKGDAFVCAVCDNVYLNENEVEGSGICEECSRTSEDEDEGE